MWMKSLFVALLIASASSPALAQSALDSTAATGELGGWSNGPTNGNFNGGSGSTGKQGDRLGLQATSSSSPMKGGGNAPGNLALKQLGGSSLPPTKLSGFVKQGGDAVFGGDGELLPKYFTFTQDHRIEQAMQQNPKLTTNHRISSPSAWDFPN